MKDLAVVATVVLSSLLLSFAVYTVLAFLLLWSMNTLVSLNADYSALNIVAAWILVFILYNPSRSAVSLQRNGN